MVALMARRTLIWAVNANWNSGNGYWNVNANSVENPSRWNVSNQVLSRYYFLSSAFAAEVLLINPFFQPPIILPKSSISVPMDIYWLLEIKRASHKFEDIISVENIFEAWQEFIRGKRNKRDVQEFSLRLMNNIFNLHHDLVSHTYKHGGYQAFNISDPKPRNIHKASVRDRIASPGGLSRLISLFWKNIYSWLFFLPAEQKFKIFWKID